MVGCVSLDRALHHLAHRLECVCTRRDRANVRHPTAWPTMRVGASEREISERLWQLLRVCEHVSRCTALTLVFVFHAGRTSEEVHGGGSAAWGVPYVCMLNVLARAGQTHSRWATVNAGLSDTGRVPPLAQSVDGRRSLNVAFRPTVGLVSLTPHQGSSVELVGGGFYALAAITYCNILCFDTKQFDSPSVVGRPSLFGILLSRSLLLLAPLLAPLLARLLLAHP
jgi:hypothetical protein